MIEAEILTVWEAGAMPNSLQPALPAGVGMQDTTGTAKPVLGQHVVVRVTCPDLTHLNGYVVLWNRPLPVEAVI